MGVGLVRYIITDLGLLALKNIHRIFFTHFYNRNDAFDHDIIIFKRNIGEVLIFFQKTFKIIVCY